MSKTQIKTQALFTLEDCRANPQNLYVFGDNLARKGTAGQACIRYANNSYGVATKHKPSHSEEAYFNNNNITNVIDDLAGLADIYAAGTYDYIVFPTDGLGTGYARLREKAPKILDYLQEFQQSALENNTIERWAIRNNTHRYTVILDASYRCASVEEVYSLEITEETILQYFGELKEHLTAEDIKDLIANGFGECISEELIDIGDPIQDTLIGIREELPGCSNIIYDIGQQQ